LSSNQIQEQNFSIQILKESVAIEGGNRGKTLVNSTIIDSEHNDVQLHEIFSHFTSEYSLLIVTSLKTCSLCREQLLEMWNELYKTERSLPIFLLIAEEEGVSKSGRRGVKASMSRLNIEIPFYIEKEPVLLNELGVTANQTPLSIIVSRDKKIIAIDRATQVFPDSSLKFKDFFLQLN
jgi:hypothetical protein